MAAYNHMLQTRNTIRRLMSLGFMPLPFVRMCLGNLRRAAAPLQVQAPALEDLFLYFWTFTSTGRFNTRFLYFHYQCRNIQNLTFHWVSLSLEKNKNTATKSNQEI